MLDPLVTPTNGVLSVSVPVTNASTAVLKQNIHFVKGFTYTSALRYKGTFNALDAVVMQYETGDTPVPGNAISMSATDSSPLVWTPLVTTQDVSRNGNYDQVEISVRGPALVYLDDVAVSAQVYAKAALPPAPVEPLYLSWLIHIEDPDALTNSATYFQAHGVRGAGQGLSYQWSVPGHSAGE